MNRWTTAWLALLLAGCPGEPDDPVAPDPYDLPQPTLERSAPTTTYERDGAFERAGEELDEAVDDAGDAAGRAGDWVEDEADELRRP